jgi:hypothetical protein
MLILTDSSNRQSCVNSQSDDPCSHADLLPRASSDLANI